MWTGQPQKESATSKVIKKFKAWPESSMVQQSKLGESIKGGVYQLNLMDNPQGFRLAIGQSILINTTKQKGRKSIRMLMEKSQCLCCTQACRQHGGILT